MNKKAMAVESIFVMLLFVLMTLSIVFLILAGKGSFDRVTSQQEKSNQHRVVASYLRTKLKQNMYKNTLDVVVLNQKPAIRLDHMGDEADYVTYIYQEGDSLYEAYQLKAAPFSSMYGEKVAALSNLVLDFNLKESSLYVTYKGPEETSHQWIALMYEGGNIEK